MGTHTQNSFAGDFLTFFDAGTIIRFLRMPSCALSIKGHTGVLTLNEEVTSSIGQTLEKE